MPCTCCAMRWADARPRAQWKSFAAQWAWRRPQAPRGSALNQPAHSPPWVCAHRTGASRMTAMHRGGSRAWHADLAARGGSLAGPETPQQVMALGKDDWQPALIQLQPVAQAELDQCAVTPPHSPPVWPMPPGRPAASLTKRGATVPDAARSVCKMVGAQCPMRSTLPVLRQRNARAVPAAASTAGPAC